MGIKITTSKKEFTDYIQNEVDSMMTKQIEILKLVGAEAYKAQMQTRTSVGVYTTQTGNLQSSIGYCILQKGSVVFTAGFEDSNGTEQGVSGVAQGKDYLGTVASEFGSADFALVMVAGMSYAVYVERLHNLNVLTTAELYADKLLPELLNQLNK